MATYLIGKEIKITRQAGDAASVQITVPNVLSMTGYTARFQVRNNAGRVLIDKSGDALTIVSQVIYIPLLPEDTKNRDGVHRWKLQVSNINGPITIGRGDFQIIKEMIV